MYFGLGDGVLEANALSVKKSFAQGDHEHGHGSLELQVVQSLLKRFILVDDVDVRDLGDLVKSLDSVLDELSELDDALHGV